MQDNKLTRYLKTLDGDEMKRFVLFLRSPYHSTNKPALKLVEYFNKYHPSYENPRLKKETIFKKIYGAGRPFHEGRFEQVMTQTVKLFEQFIAVEAVLSDPLKLCKNRMQGFRVKRMDKAYSKEAGKRKKLIAEMGEGPKRRLEEYELGRDLFFHPATERSKVEMDSLEKYVENLDHFFLWEKQLTTNFLLNRQLVFPKRYEIKLYDETTKAFYDKIAKNYTLLILNKLAKIQFDFDGEKLIYLSEEFQANFEKIEGEFRTDIYSMIRNLMAMGLRSMPEYFSQPSLSLMKFAREKEMDLIGGEISANGFTGLISIASKEGEYDYALKILEKYSGLVNVYDREDVFYLGHGYVAFWQGTVENNKELIESAVDTLLKVNQNKPFFTYQVKSLLLRCYFELYLHDISQQYFVNDFSLAFERHLQRDKSLSENKSKAYSNFCKMVRKLVKMKFATDENRGKLNRIKQQASTEKLLFAREWIMNKVEEMEMHLLH